MQKAVGRISALLSRIIFIGMSIQIVLGIVWMCGNFLYFQDFGESAFYVSVSKNFICDEYTGILYPVVLLLARGIGRLFGVPYYCVIYAVQLLGAWYGACRLLGRLKKTGRALRLWGGLGILTLPMAMQCHLAVLPYSLASSFFLLEISSSLRIILEERCGGLKQMAKIASFWLLCVLLMPEYLYLGAAPVVFVLLCELARTLKECGTLSKCGKNSSSAGEAFGRLGAMGLAAAVFLGIILGMNSLTQVEGYYGKTLRSPEASLVSRFAWSSLMDNYDSWPGEVQEALDWGKLQESAFYPDNMARVFGPLVEEALGEEEAREFFLAAAKQAWKQNREGILHEIIWDAAAYTVSPVAFQMQLTGRGYDAYTSRNYEIMRHNTPVLARIYMDYGCWWFAAGLGISAVLQLLCIFRDRSIVCRKNVLACVLILCSLSGMILWYTMQGAGIMDYKNTIAVNCFWTVWSLLVMWKGLEEYACFQREETV